MLWEMTNVVTFYSGGKEISAFPGNVPARRLRKSKLRKKRVFSTGTRTINPFLISQPQMIDTGSFFSHTVALHSPPCPHMYLFNFFFGDQTSFASLLQPSKSLVPVPVFILCPVCCRLCSLLSFHSLRSVFPEFI